MPAAFQFGRYLSLRCSMRAQWLPYCFGDGYNVVPSLRPIDVPHGHPVLLRHLPECFCPLGRVLRVANSLIREPREGDVGWHGCPPSTACAKVCYPTLDGRHSGVAITGDGGAIFRHACWMDLEGIVSKRIGSRYESGKTRAWPKAKNPAFRRSIAVRSLSVEAPMLGT